MSSSATLQRLVYWMPFVGACVLLTGTATAPVRADLSYTVTMSIKGGVPEGMPLSMMPKIQSTSYYKAGQERTDSSITSPIMAINSVVISDCKAGKIYTLDPVLNIYTVSDMASSAPDPFGLGSALGGLGGMSRKMSGSTESGTVTTTVTVADKGQEQVNGVDAHHWTVTTAETATGNVKVNSEPNVFDIWTDNTQHPISCRVMSALDTSTPATVGHVRYIYKGDTDGMRKVMSGVPVRMQFIVPGHGMTMEMDRTSLSTDTLSDSLFTPPAGARQVTEDEYSAAERKAMTSHMHIPAGGIPSVP